MKILSLCITWENGGWQRPPTALAGANLHSWTQRRAFQLSYYAGKLLFTITTGLIISTLTGLRMADYQPHLKSDLSLSPPSNIYQIWYYDLMFSKVPILPLKPCKSP